MYAKQGTFQDVVAKMFWVSLLAIFSNFICLLLYCAILILSYTQDHFCLAKGVSMEMANIVFDMVTQKVIKDVALSLLPYTTRRYYTIYYNICCI
jgi:hypothetical protein